MTSSRLAAVAPSDETPKARQKASRAPLFLPAPGMYHRASRPNHRTQT